MRLKLTDDTGDVLILCRSSSSASFFDDCVERIRSRLVGTDLDGAPIDTEKITAYSVQLSYTEIGFLRAQDVLPWIPKHLLSGIPRKRLAWIVLETGK